MEYNYERLSDDIRIAVSADHTFGTDAVLLSYFAKPKYKDKALDMLAAQGPLSANPFKSPAGMFYDCSGFVVCGLIDEFEEGEDWCIDTDDIIDDSPSDVGDDIKALRAKAKMSQAKFAAYFGMTIKTLQNWEQGVSACPEYVLSLIKYKLKNENII